MKDESKKNIEFIEFDDFEKFMNANKNNIPLIVWNDLQLARFKEFFVSIINRHSEVSFSKDTKYAYRSSEDILRFMTTIARAVEHLYFDHRATVELRQMEYVISEAKKEILLLNDNETVEENQKIKLQKNQLIEDLLKKIVEVKEQELHNELTFLYKLNLCYWGLDKMGEIMKKADAEKTDLTVQEKFEKFSPVFAELYKNNDWNQNNLSINSENQNYAISVNHFASVIMQNYAKRCFKAGVDIIDRFRDEVLSKFTDEELLVFYNNVFENERQGLIKNLQNTELKGTNTMESSATIFAFINNRDAILEKTSFLENVDLIKHAFETGDEALKLRARSMMLNLSVKHISTLFLQVNRLMMDIDKCKQIASLMSESEYADTDKWPINHIVGLVKSLIMLIHTDCNIDLKRFGFNADAMIGLDKKANELNESEILNVLFESKDS